MFIYQKDGKIRITFDDNKPVNNPAINLDLKEQKLIVNDEPIEHVVEDKLVDDVVLQTAEVVDFAKTIVLDGHKISLPDDTAGDGVYHVVEGGYLTINGDGIIDGVGKNIYNMVIWADGGHVVINGGTFTNRGAKADVDPTHFDLIYAKNGGIVEINAGYFDCETPKWTLNSHDTKKGKFIVKGGSFVGFDPSRAETEPGGVTNFVAEGYKVVCKDNIYTVIKN